ncbi:MAG: RCC1 domain-containing protein [Myxococcota bacterium]
MEEESADYITSGRDHVCFIRSDGTVGCVGDNDNEQFLQMPLGVLW